MEGAMNARSSSRPASPMLALMLLALVLLALVLLATAVAPALADPMQPLAGSAGQPGVASVVRAAEASSNDVSLPLNERFSGAELKAIRLSSNGRWEALIGSHWVRAGDRIKDARILEVRSVDVVVQASDGRRETLSMLPRLLPLAAASGSTPAKTGKKAK
jgi:hypothetical protein